MSSAEEPPRQAVIVYFKLSDGAWGDPEEFADMYDWEDALTEAIEEAGVGEFDGIGRGLGFLDFSMYGPSADPASPSSNWSSSRSLLARVCKASISTASDELP